MQCADQNCIVIDAGLGAALVLPFVQDGLPLVQGNAAHFASGVAGNTLVPGCLVGGNRGLPTPGVLPLRPGGIDLLYGPGEHIRTGGLPGRGLAVIFLQRLLGLLELGVVAQCHLAHIAVFIPGGDLHKIGPPTVA